MVIYILGQYFVFCCRHLAMQRPIVITIQADSESTWTSSLISRSVYTWPVPAFAVKHVKLVHSYLYLDFNDQWFTVIYSDSKHFYVCICAHVGTCLCICVLICTRTCDYKKIVANIANVADKCHLSLIADDTNCGMKVRENAIHVWILPKLCCCAYRPVQAFTCVQAVLLYSLNSHILSFLGG